MREQLARAVRLLAVHDGGERQGGLARDEDVEPAEVVLPVARDRVLHRGVALGGGVKRGGGGVKQGREWVGEWVSQ